MDSKKNRQDLSNINTTLMSDAGRFKQTTSYTRVISYSSVGTYEEIISTTNHQRGAPISPTTHTWGRSSHLRYPAQTNASTGYHNRNRNNITESLSLETGRTRSGSFTETLPKKEEEQFPRKFSLQINHMKSLRFAASTRTNPTTPHEPDKPGISPKVSPSDEEEYNIETGRRIAVIFNHEIYKNDIRPKRTGTENDVERLKSTLKQLNFTIKEHIHHDMKKAGIMEQIDKLASETRQYACLMIFVLTHGEEDNELWASNKRYAAKEIYKPFRANKCTALAGKPKIFVFQACRGTKQDEGTRIRTDGSAKRSTYTIPNHADFLIVHSSVPGYESYRDPEQGTWFIQTFCDVIEDEMKKPSEKRKHFTDILTTINRKIAITKKTHPDDGSLKQCSSYISTFTKSLYFK